jgi:hypothetical protein
VLSVTGRGQMPAKTEAHLQHLRESPAPWFRASGGGEWTTLRQASRLEDYGLNPSKAHVVCNGAKYSASVVRTLIDAGVRGSFEAIGAKVQSLRHGTNR